MKKGYIYAAIIGGAFFAVPYLGLGIELIPSLAISATAYGAGELVFHYSNKETKNENISLKEILENARSKNSKIRQIIPQIEDEELVSEIKEINDTVKKIIDAIEKKPDKYEKVNNFFDYYLPVTINILNRYDEIENQSLNTEESNKFMNSTKNMVKKINKAFKVQLANIYQADIIDTDAEMKVFENMLKSDGYQDDDFNISKGEKK